MRNALMDQSQAGIKITGRNNNNLRYADDTTLMANSEEELKNLLMKVKRGEWKSDLKLNIQKTKIIVFGPITSWQTDGEKMDTVTNFIFLGSKINVDSDYSNEIILAPWKKSYNKSRQHIKKQRYHFAHIIHVHWVSDAIQPSHPLSPPFLLPSVSPRSGSFPMSWLFPSGGQSIEA